MLTGYLLVLKSKKILFIDYSAKNSQVVNMLAILFRKVFVAANNQEAMTFYDEEAPDLIISNIKQNPLNGIKLIRHLRAYDYKIPIIILAEMHEDNLYLDIANLSVDAYLYEPLDNQIFINTLCKSIKRNINEDALVMLNQHLIFHIASKQLYLNGTALALGSKESQLLHLLITNRTRTLTKEEIEKNLWPLDSISDSALKKLIHRIRKKTQIDLIVSVRGVGYRLTPKNTLDSISNLL